ncbi:nadp-specific glutamate dehydrogenase 1-related [Holotrichia oblita]|nr:nadp-specific glutamate dehydrogenase 1-related [Holotrichia oblita]
MNMIMLLFIFVIAAFLGVELISKVPSQLHTPLMSGTNAISGITIVGALAICAVQATGTLGMILSFLAVIFAAINVVGGYLITDRMLGIKKLGKPQTARQGNYLSSLGMLIAVIAVFFENDVIQSWNTSNWLQNGYLWCFLGIVIGSAIGIIWAKKVKMTGMPELVALFNGFGGLASLLVAVSEFLKNPEGNEIVSTVSISLTILIGAVTFTGSVLAWAKLSEKITGRAIIFKGQKLINLFLILASAAAIIIYILPGMDVQTKTISIWVLTGISLIFGFTFVLPIGGGDMPVVISLLNSFSGLAASMAGFIISNTVLIVAGCLVGASGVVLTLIMCKAMNRSITNLLFSGFGAAETSSEKGGSSAEPKSISVEDAYLILEAAQSVVFIPGYGMAVAQAQHAVKELAAKLEENGAEVNFAIHPVAGRMPGHMNVLLAEADIPYEQLKTMDEMNPMMPTQDVAVVIGANDVVNPAAENNSSSPIYGMPIIKAYEAKTVFVLKRGKGKGFSGIENDLFGMQNTLMIYGDAKATISSLTAKVLEQAIKKNPNEPEFHQAMTEILPTLQPLIDEHPEYEKEGILERLVEPERQCIFRVPWIDDNGNVQVNRGFEQIFKNSLTGLPIGGGKGGSDFDPKGKSNREVMAFCQSFINELYRHIGADRDIPAGDIGVGGREIGFMYGQYKKLTGQYEGVFTGKGLTYGGSLVRTEATGYGLVYMVENMLSSKETTFTDKIVVISGSGNVAIYAAEKAAQFGAKVVTMSDSNGYIYDSEGIDVNTVKLIKEKQRGRIHEYLKYRKNAEYFENGRVWSVPCHVALPCATQNEIQEEDAKNLIKNGCMVVAEGSNMSTTLAATKLFLENEVYFSPGKAANAGGVAVSALEMAQNSSRLSWSFEEIDCKLRTIMHEIYVNSYNAAERYGMKGNLAAGANIAGFGKVAEAMLQQGVV